MSVRAECHLLALLDSLSTLHGPPQSFVKITFHAITKNLRPSRGSKGEPLSYIMINYLGTPHEVKCYDSPFQCSGVFTENGE